jgi:hypothetical protein
MRGKLVMPTFFPQKQPRWVKGILWGLLAFFAALLVRELVVLFSKSWRA